MGLSAEQILRVLSELAGPVLGGHVQRVTQPQPDRLCLRVRVPGETHTLLISIRPGMARIHRTEAPTSSGGKAASAFCMTLRKHLVGCRLNEIEVPPGDRVVTIRLTRGPDPASELRLIAELFGRGANVVLVDAEDRILTVMRPQPGETRALLTGRPYLPPPPSRAADAPRAELPAPSAEDPFAYNREIEATFQEREETDERDRQRRSLSKDLRRQRKKLESRRSKVEAEKTGLATPEQSTHMGELLKAHLGALGGPNRRGLEEAEVADWNDPDGGTIAIRLNPKRTLRENMERYFERAKKAVRAKDRIAAHLEWITERLAEIADLDRRIAEATHADALVALRPAVDALAGSARSASRAGGTGTPSASGPRRFVSKDGVEILVGRNARDNDALTFRVARGSDLWLHVQDYPGSHVIVRVAKDRMAPPETLLDAAHLAAHYSEARDHATVTVQYTGRKYVRKPRGAPPGAVLLQRRKTLFLRPDSARLDRLLSRGAPFERPRGASNPDENAT